MQGMKVESCTQQDVEIRVRQAFLVSAAKSQLPLQVEDAARREDANQVIKSRRKNCTQGKKNFIYPMAPYL